MMLGRPAHVVGILATLGLILLISSGCWLFREIDACETNSDCPDGQFCYNNSGILVCLPEGFLDESDMLDGGASDSSEVDQSRPDAEQDAADTELGMGDAELDSGAHDTPPDVSFDHGDSERDGSDDHDTDGSIVTDAAEEDASAPDATPDTVEDGGGRDLDTSTADIGPCDTGPVNLCGGCGVLANDPGDSCGPCDLDEYVCNGSDPAHNTTICDGFTYGNACDGCGALPNEPGEACGPCGVDEYVCDGSEAVACDGSTANDCGGCAALAGVPDEVCSCGGLGDAVWSCDGTEAVVCSDDNDTFETAEFLGNFDETDQFQVVAYIDAEDDVDVYRMDLTQDLPSQTIRVGVAFERVVDVEAPSYAIQYALSAFYRYLDVRGANILTYTCGHNTCAYWDASLGSLMSTSCEAGSTTFNPTQDLYGCRGVGPDSSLAAPFDLAGGDSIDWIDDNGGDNPDDRGIAYIVVSAPLNSAPLGCEEYTFTVSF